MDTEEVLGTVMVAGHGRFETYDTGEVEPFVLLVAKDGNDHVLGLDFVFSQEQAETFLARYEWETTFESQEAAREVLDTLGVPTSSERDAVVADGLIAAYLALMLDMATEYQMLKRSMTSIQIIRPDDLDDDPPSPWDPDDPSDPSSEG